MCLFIYVFDIILFAFFVYDILVFTTFLYKYEIICCTFIAIY